MGLARFIPSESESSYWPLYTNRIGGFATQLATMDGLENISPGHNLQFIPYMVRWTAVTSLIPARDRYSLSTARSIRCAAASMPKQSSMIPSRLT